MSSASLIDTSASSRELVRTMRKSLSTRDDVMPESLAWHTFMELRNRNFPGAERLFISTLRTLHTRRSSASSDMPNDDHLHEEHRLTSDPLLAELWKAFKKCIRSNRTGPAAQLLREIEEHIDD